MQLPFRRHVYSNFDSLNIFSPLINEIFRTRANCYSQSQLIDIFCTVINVARDIFKIQDGGHIFCCLSKLKAFLC